MSWLKRSLGTKDIRQANTRAKLVLMEFDQIIAKVEATLKLLPVKVSLSDHEIKRIVAYRYAFMLAEDEEHRNGGRGTQLKAIKSKYFSMNLPRSVQLNKRDAAGFPFWATAWNDISSIPRS